MYYSQAAKSYIDGYFCLGNLINGINIHKEGGSKFLDLYFIYLIHKRQILLSKNKIGDLGTYIEEEIILYCKLSMHSARDDCAMDRMNLIKCSHDDCQQTAGIPLQIAKITLDDNQIFI